MGCGESSQTAEETKAVPATVPVNNKASGKKTAVGGEKKKLELWKQVHSAVRWNKIDEARGLLQDHPDAVNCQDEGNGNLPIHIAAQNGHLDVLKLLIEKGAQVNGRNGKGNTPLHMALGYDYYDCAMLLMRHGASDTETNSAGIPAKRGLEGDKCFGLAALITAEKDKNASNAKKALDLCENEIDLLDKAAFAGTGLKLKKSLEDKWTTEMQAQFKSIMMRL